jgi:hypothetical protein
MVTPPCPSSHTNLIPTFVGGLLSLAVGGVGFVLGRTGLSRPRLRVHTADFPDKRWWVNIALGSLGGKATVTHIWVKTSQGDAEIIAAGLPRTFEPGGESYEWGIPVGLLPDEDLKRKFRAHTTTSRIPMRSRRRRVRPGGIARQADVELMWPKDSPWALQHAHQPPPPPATGTIAPPPP